MASSPALPPIATVLPPLLLGTAAFNSQYNADPFALPVDDIVRTFLHSSSTTSTTSTVGFDTSPYYGPAELLLGRALSSQSPPRTSYFLSTKVGRLASTTFDYSPAWIQHSVARSLRRLHATHLDLVYCHDVEFVTPAQVLTAVRTLRALRDAPAATVRYIGISGFPVTVLATLAELVLAETGEPLDAVLSYGNYTVQNTRLHSLALARLQRAGVGCVLNASLLGMGLLRGGGVPVGAMGDFHPSGRQLRQACAAAAADLSARDGVKLEEVAYRWALENWADVGTPTAAAVGESGGHAPLGVSVIGVSYVEELRSAMGMWTDILAARAGDAAALERRRQNDALAAQLKDTFGESYDEVWESPGADYVRTEPTAEHWRGDEELWPELHQQG